MISRKPVTDIVTPGQLNEVLHTGGVCFEVNCNIPPAGLTKRVSE
jgi:hypothetical protein